MVVLTAIGAFFKKIWDWIRQTAWIQPLLIVGIIFGVIFSIPAIVNAIKDAKEQADATETYYHKYQLSLEGGATSTADKTTNLLYKAIDNPTEENINAVKEDVGSTKFFFVYVEDNCEYCLQAKYGFDYLEKNWSSLIHDGSEFKLVSIFADEYTSETTSNKTAFVQYMERFPSFFELAGEAAENTDYYELGHIKDEDVSALADADPETFKAPAIFLVDFNAGPHNQGISEVMFGVSGDSDLDKATLLTHCWNHTDEFSIDNKTL